MTVETRKSALTTGVAAATTRANHYYDFGVIFMLFSSNYTITIGSAVLRFLLYFELMVF